MEQVFNIADILRSLGFPESTYANQEDNQRNIANGWSIGAPWTSGSGGAYTNPRTQTYLNPPAYANQLGDVAATMYGQSPNTNMANMLAASGYTNRYGGQVSTPQSSQGAYQNLMNRQSAQVASQPTSITVPTTNTGGK